MTVGVFTKVTPSPALSSNYFLKVLPQTPTTLYFSLQYIWKVEPRALQGEKCTCSSFQTTFSSPKG